MPARASSGERRGRPGRSDGVEPRVLHLTEALGGGIQTVLMRLSARQVEAGAAVSVSYLDRPEAPCAADLRTQFHREVRLLPISSAPGRLRRLVSTFRATRSALKAQEYDAVHLHSAYAGFAGRLAKLVTRSSTEVFYSPHGFPFLRTNSPLGVRLLWQFLEACAARVGVCVLICESELATARARLHPRRSALLRTGVDVATLATYRSHGSSEPPVVAMVGRICYQKAPWRFAAVARALQGEARFVWVGDGEPADRDRWLGDVGVEVTGWVTEEEVRKALIDTSVLLFPTLWEGMPMSVMEAQAQGVPAVVSDAVGNRDAVLSGRTGYIATSDEELVERTAELLRDEALRLRMADAAVSWAHEGLSDADLGSRSLALYREAIGAAGPTR